MVGFMKVLKKPISRIGVDFDKNYYESDTYLLGKEMIKAGLKDNIFFEKSDGSVWIDLTDEGLMISYWSVLMALLFI